MFDCQRNTLEARLDIILLSDGDEVTKLNRSVTLTLLLLTNLAYFDDMLFICKMP